MCRRQSQQSVTAGVHEVKASWEGLEDNCGEVPEKVMEQGRCEKEAHGEEGQRGEEDTHKGAIAVVRGAVAAWRSLTNG